MSEQIWRPREIIKKVVSESKTLAEAKEILLCQYGINVSIERLERQVLKDKILKEHLVEVTDGRIYD